MGRRNLEMKNLLKIFSLCMLMFGSMAFGQSKLGDITLVDPTYTSPTSKIKIKFGLKWGRPSQGCSGFGVCGFEVTISWKGSGGNGILMDNDPTLSKAKGDYMLVLEVGAPIASGVDTNLYVEKDIAFDINGIKGVIPAGVYPLVKGKTQYGNYFIALK
jgi:hypothetical protein